MSLMLAKTYEAFKAAGAPEDKAQAAAEEIAGFERDISDIKASLKLHSTMLGIITAGIAALILKAFFA